MEKYIQFLLNKKMNKFFTSFPNPVTRVFSLNVEAVLQSQNSLISAKTPTPAPVRLQLKPLYCHLKNGIFLVLTT